MNSGAETALIIDVDLDPEDLNRLRACLPPQLDVEAVAAVLAKAGALEVLHVATERADAPSGAADIRRLRVYCMILAGAEMETLEPIVAGVFKVTSRQARGLVDSTLARYSSRLAEEVRKQIKDALEGAVEGDHEDWIVTLRSHFVESRVVEFLSTQPVEAPIKMSVGRRWRFTHEAFSVAANQYGAAERPKPRR